MVLLCGISIAYAPEVPIVIEGCFLPFSSNYSIVNVSQLQFCDGPYFHYLRNF